MGQQATVTKAWNHVPPERDDLGMELPPRVASGGADLVPAVPLEERVRHLRAALVADAEKKHAHRRRVRACGSSSSSGTASPS